MACVPLYPGQHRATRSPLKNRLEQFQHHFNGGHKQHPAQQLPKPVVANKPGPIIRAYHAAQAACNQKGPPLSPNRFDADRSQRRADRVPLV